MRKIEILDTTLRDGAQSEGISFSLEDKLKIIKRLDDFGIDYIEVGNPASCPKDVEVFKKATEFNLKNARLVAFGATVKKNLAPHQDENIIALLAAETKTVAVFGKSHAEQVESILRVTLAENISMLRRTIEFLTEQGRDVIFDAEHFFDGYKSNPEYALETLKTAIQAGASVIVLCDTNGGCFPDEIGRIVKEITAADLCCKEIKLGIHCHNDTGCAVANSITAAEHGVFHIQGTFIGNGERCGNTNLSTLIPNLQCKMKVQIIPKKSIATLTETARFIAQVANINLENNMPYVGASAFSHKAGMHIDGVMKNPGNFEHINPEFVGNQRNILLSEMSGRGTLLSKIKEIAPNLTKDDLIVKNLTDKVKQLECKGYQFEAAEASFKLLVLKETGRFTPYFEIVDYKIISSLSDVATATVKIRVGDRYEITAAEGQGPVNAIDKALRKALEVFYPTLSEMRLTDYKVRIINGSDNTASVTRVLIESSLGKSRWTTVGAGDNIISASLIALTDSVEYMLMLVDR